MDPYIGQLVVLRMMWNPNAGRIGVVVEQPDKNCDKFIVMWTTKSGIELKIHIKDALMPITEYTHAKVKERSCVFK